MIPANPPAGTRGADRLVQSLQRAGVRCLFTLSGNHIMPVFDALIGSGIRLIHTRHEAATVHMADAWSRLTGEVGVALVTGGPGHANAVSALYTAQMAEAPVVLLSGHAPNSQLGMGAFQEMRQADLAAPVCKASWTCAGPDAVAPDLARAMQIARSGRPGPVHLSLPSDALEGRADAATVPALEAFATHHQSLGFAQAQKLMAWLQRAQRPLILAGPSACTRSGRTRTAALQAACGVPVIGMESPRGVADPALGALAEMLVQADAVLLLGKRLDFTLKFGQAPTFAADARWAQVDADEPEIERSRRALGPRLEITEQADLPSALMALQHAASTPVADSGWLSAVRSAVDWRPPQWSTASSTQPARLHPVQALKPLQALLDSHPDAVFVSDGGEIGQWAQACLRAPQRVLNGVAGSIGSALPFALAARCALPPEVPVVAVSGDGSIGFHLSEFDTAVRYRLPVVVLVGNDARWNAEHQIQLKDYGPERLIGCELEPTRYDLATAALGGHGEWVVDAQALPAALQRAQASGLPACVNVMIEGLPAPLLRRPAP
ncbi:MAG: thiamine pyrophosphate-binding protein [Rubrivivax sp.]|nr:thiamine pyrophosphate-binding protein [Rubrivivax sp.]